MVRMHAIQVAAEEWKKLQIARLADSMICVNQSKIMHWTVNESVNVNVQCVV